MSEATLDTIQAVLVATTVWATGVGLGLSARMAAILAPFRDGRYVAKVAALDVLLVPVAMWLAVSALLPTDGVVTGLLLVAFASAGPLGIKLTHLAGGDVAGAMGLVVVLELANLASMPVWSSLVGIADSATIGLDIVRTLVLLVLLPIGVGMAVGRLRPGVMPSWEPWLSRTSSIGVAAIMVLVIGRHLDLLADGSGPRALATAGLVIAFALLAAWRLGGPARDRRVATSLVTGVRANAAAIAIATTAFSDDPSVAVGVVIASTASIVLSVLFAVALNRWKRMGASSA